LKSRSPTKRRAARGAMLKQLIRSCGWPLDPALDVDEVSAVLAKKMQQMSGRNLALLVRRAAQKAPGPSGSPQDSPLTRESLLAALAP